MAKVSEGKPRLSSRKRRTSTSKEKETLSSMGMSNQDKHAERNRCKSVGTIRGQTLGTSSGFAASPRSEEHTSEIQSLMRISYAVFCFKYKIRKQLTDK